MKISVGEALKLNRLANNLTLERLAENLNNIYPDENFTKGKLSKWERDSEVPKITSLKRVADYYGLTIDDLIKYSSDDEQLKLESKKQMYTSILQRYGYDVRFVKDFVYINDGYGFNETYTINDFINQDPQFIVPNKKQNNTQDFSEYRYFPIGISAGALEDVDGISDYDLISIADKLLGKYARRDSIIILKVNGESMNQIIPNGSFLVVDTSKTNVINITNGDIIVFSNNNEYCVKRYFNDRLNQRFIFSPESNDPSFIPIIVSYEDSDNLKLIGKVVKYIVNLD